MDGNTPEIIYPEPVVQIDENLGENSMDASVNCYADRRADECLEVGLEGIASSQRAGYAAEQTALNVGLSANATAQRMAVAELDSINKVGHQVCDASRDGIAATERMGLFNSGVTERTASRTQDEVERFGLSELETIHASERRIYAGLSQNAKDILLKSCADTASIKDQSASQFKDILLQNAANAKDAAVTACNNVKDLIILGDKHYSQIQIEALKNKEELARQIAECCCENKALLLETSHQTQDVVRKLDEQRLRDELARTREELIALRLRATLPPPLTGTIPL